MDPKMAWYQPEQEGPALDVWKRVWAAEFAPSLPKNGTSSNAAGVAARGPSPPKPAPSGDTGGQGADFPGLGMMGMGNPCFPYHPSYVLHSNQTNQKFDEALRKENPARTFGLGVNPNVKLSHNNGCPWLVRGKLYSTGLIGLHEEIEDFYRYMSPTTEEHGIRLLVIQRIKECILNLWPTAQVDVFGSFKTGLYLPTSDIDIHVKYDIPESTVYRDLRDVLKDALIEAGIADADTTTHLNRASVPIVKLTDKKTGVKLDVSLNVDNGIRAAELIKKFIVHYPALPKLVLVLKQFVLERDLNQVFSGGISSYSLILMAVSFFQLHHRENAGSSMANLGMLLIEFFELYGVHFNYDRVAISVKDGGTYKPKHKMVFDRPRPIITANDTVLCIEDPLTPGNDIGRSSYGVVRVKIAFNYAYITLRQGVDTGNPGISNPNEYSILGRVVRITDEVVEYRGCLRSVYNSGNPSAAVGPVEELFLAKPAAAAEKKKTKKKRTGGDRK